MKSKTPLKIKLATGFIILLTLMSGYACVSLQSLQQAYDSQDPYQGGPYPAALDSWTRKSRIYSGGLDLELIAAATFKTAAFREAYTAEYARTYKLCRVEQEKMRQDQMKAATMYNDFTVSVYTPEKRRNDLDTKGSIWKIYLKRSDDIWIKPVEIRRIKPADAVLTHFFPYISHWDVAYLLRFPIAVPGTNEPVYLDKTAPIKLVITGVRGTAELIWDGKN